MKSIALAVLAATLVIAASTQAEEPPTPRTLAFVVGIERYDHTELDKLKYAADDARAIYAQLGTIAILEPGSVLLVADDDDPSGKTVTADQLRTALQLFVQRIKNNMNVVVYLGGHGTLSAAKTLHFLPSDYSPENGTRYVRVPEIIEMFRDWIDGNALNNVKLTFFVNMCGAGNALAGKGAMSVQNDEEMVTFAQKVFKEEKFGFQRYAILPATPRARNTFEKDELRASIFAYHLRVGLAGRAAKNGVVTSRSLFNYVQGKIGEDLPWNDDFDGEITIGVTRELDGQADLLVGTALLAAAQTLDDSTPGSDSMQHRTAMLDLALERFRDATERIPPLEIRARLREAQTVALRDGTLAGFQKPVIPEDANSDQDSVDLRQLFHPDNMVSTPPSLGQLTKLLQEGAPFNALIIDTASAYGDDARKAWAEVFSSFPGKRDVRTVMYPRGSGPVTVPEGIRAIVEGWRAVEADVDHPSRLFLVYVGQASIELETQRLYPFDRSAIETLSNRWPGPVSVFFLSPFGGNLLNGTPPSGNVSLFLAAKEPNGMTFGSPDRSTMTLLAEAFGQGVDRPEDYEPLREYTATMSWFLRSPADERYVIGTPSWDPNWGGPNSSTVAQQQLSPLRRFALHMANGCGLETLAKCDTTSLSRLGEGNGSQDPFETLVKAGSDDLAGRSDSARTAYVQVVGALRATTAPADRPFAAAGEAALRDVVSTVEQRSKPGPSRRAVIVRMAIDDYTSPLIADLPHGRNDLDAYANALTAALNMTAQVEVRDVMRPQTAQELVGALRTAKQSTDADDLIIFVYSGRGLEIGTRRYLTTAATQLCDGEEEPNQKGPCVGEEQAWREVVDLWTVADEMRDRWFTAIYDAQFTAPRFHPNRTDLILDKHLNSVRPLAPLAESESDKEEEWAASNPSAGTTELVRGSLPPRQVHFWVEGTLNEADAPPAPCAAEDSQIASPLAAAVVDTLPKAIPGTYRSWLKALRNTNCFEVTDEIGDELANGHVVADGDLDLPILASGRGAELVEFFRNDHGRHDANLRAAEGVIRVALDRAPNETYRLAHGAVLIALAMHQQHRTNRSPNDVETSEWLRIAGEGLGKPLMEPDYAMKALQVELLARRHVLDDDADQARVELRRADPRVLARRGLALRLVNLTESAVRQQPIAIIDDTSRTLRLAEGALKDGDVAMITTAKNKLTEMLRTEQARRSSAYAISPP